MLFCVISGGQTGVDRGALDAAAECRMLHAGWCPGGRRAEDGIIPQHYPLTETPSAAYRQRTEWNVRDSDGTLIISRGVLTGGTAHTAMIARRLGKELFIANSDELRSAELIIDWIASRDIRILNVAGPRARTWKRAYAVSRTLLVVVFRRCRMARDSAPESSLLIEAHLKTPSIQALKCK